MVYREKSPYTGQMDYLNGKTCFGYIVDVDENLRRARVKTLGKPGFTDDLDLQNVQWISLSLHPSGDDNSAMARIGSYCVVMFINAEPYIVGYYRPLVDSSITEAPNVSPLLPGDQGFTTIAGNSIVARVGGSVEVTATELCKIFLLPSGNLINLIGQNFEIDVDGGVEAWNADEDSGVVLWQRLVVDNVTATNAVWTQVGSTDTGALVHFTSGPAASDGTVATATADIQVQPDGTITVTSGQGSPMIVHMDPSGKIAIGTSAIELLDRIFKTFTKLGTVKVLSPLGPCAPNNQGIFWQDQVVPLMNDIKSITGTVS